MKVTLDLATLLKEGKITQAEFDKFSRLSAEATSSLVFNILVAFGVVAVSGAMLLLVPSSMTAVIVGMFVLALGLSHVQTSSQWKIVSNICVLIGSLLMGGGIVVLQEGSIVSYSVVTLLFAAAGIIASNQLLIVLSVLALSAALGAVSGYSHATYYFAMQSPTMAIAVFSILAIATYYASNYLTAPHQGLVLAAARASVFLVNFGFWIGSLWGEKILGIIIPDWFFVVVWTITLFVAGIWALKMNKRWIVNIVTVFGAIHFYTQWFERLGASPITVLIAGVLAIGLALFLRHINRSDKTTKNAEQS